MKLPFFQSYVYSKVSYGLHCYGFANKTDIQKIQVICNKLLRLLLKKDSTYSTNSLFKENRLLKIDDLHQFIILQYVHKSFYSNDNTAECLKTKFRRRANLVTYNLRDDRLIDHPLARSVSESKGCFWYGASIWNKLPIDIRREYDLIKFKTKLKEYFLSKY